MGRLKVLTLVGTRPELIKLSRVLVELDRTTEHVFVHSGQNYAPALYAQLLDDLGLRPPDHLLAAAGEQAIDTIAQALIRFDAVLAREQPEAVLFYGDTNTGLALIAAKRRQIPIFHMEAGNRCYDARVPEETNRRLLDHLCDINLPLSEHARRCLLAEGLPPDRIIKTGSPLTEVLAHYRPRIEASTILSRLSLTAGAYFLVSAHREENVDPPQQLADLLDTLEALARVHDHPVIVSTHPRTRRRLDALAAERTRALDPRIAFLEPFGFFDYVALQRHAACVLSDSGSLTEESSLLDVPAVALRQTHERHEGMDEGTVVIAGLRAARVLQAVDLVRAQAQAPPIGEARSGAGRAFRLVDDYDRGPVSRQIVRVILSYVDYVNRTVWRKEV